MCRRRRCASCHKPLMERVVVCRRCRHENEDTENQKETRTHFWINLAAFCVLLILILVLWFGSFLPPGAVLNR